MSELPKNFCYAPFVHMYVHSNEGEKVCCKSTDFTRLSDDTELSLEKRWHSNYIKDLRKKFLNNEQPDICKTCFDTEKNGGASDRTHYTKKYKNQGIKIDIEDGNQYGSPIDLDIRPGNLCNLACRMCHAGASSQIEKENRSNPAVAEFMGGYDIKSSDVLMNNNNIEFLLRDTEHKNNRIKFLGGEPTIMPEVDKFLDILIEKKAFDTPIHFTTNCTNNNKKFLDKISQFNQVTFNFSVDGTEKVVEYIRHPVKFKTINNVITEYKKFASFCQIRFALQAYNVYNVIDAVRWANSHGLYLNVDLVNDPKVLSCYALPIPIRRKLVREITSTLETMVYPDNINKDKQLSLIIPTLERIQTNNTIVSTASFAKRTKILDLSRKQHIKDYIPEIWDIIKEDYDAL